MSFKDKNYMAISKIEYLESYNKTQLDLIFKHDIMYDHTLSDSQKQRFKAKYDQLFQDQPVWQIMLSGINSIPKLQEIIGCSDPKIKKGYKDTLRSTYGVDRMNNAFFVSETVQEALIEEETLFDRNSNCDSEIDQNKEFQISKIEETKT